MAAGNWQARRQGSGSGLSLISFRARRCLDVPPSCAHGTRPMLCLLANSSQRQSNSQTQISNFPPLSRLMQVPHGSAAALLPASVPAAKCKRESKWLSAIRKIHLVVAVLQHWVFHCLFAHIVCAGTRRAMVKVSAGCMLTVCTALHALEVMQQATSEPAIPAHTCMRRSVDTRPGDLPSRCTLYVARTTGSNKKRSDSPWTMSPTIHSLSLISKAWHSRPENSPADRIDRERRLQPRLHLSLTHVLLSRPVSEV